VAEHGIEQHLEYLEVPFNLRYTVVDRTFELQVVGGLSTNFLVHNTVTMETASGDTDIGYLTNIRSVNYSGNAGIGMIYHIHRRFSLLLEPRFRYFLNSVNDPSLPATRPYALGIYTGINYTF
jgi:predicted SPOUT superfamily RNA methylase MTH1